MMNQISYYNLQSKKRPASMNGFEEEDENQVLMPPPPPRLVPPRLSLLKDPPPLPFRPQVLPQCSPFPQSRTKNVLELDRSGNLIPIHENNSQSTHIQSSVRPRFASSSTPQNHGHSSQMQSSATFNVPTSAISFNETNHGRERRLQRAVPKRDIQAAIKHGVKRVDPHNDNLFIYTHNGKEHIVTKDTVSLVTTMVKSVTLEQKKISKNDRKEHQKALKNIHSICENAKMKNNWKSHSVIIVDKSGSMGNSDVNGSRTRLGAVWLCLAQDFVEHRIKSGMAGSLDVISIISMSDNAELLVDRWPTTYVLYNRLVELFMESEEAHKLLWKKKNFQKHSKRAKKGYKSLTQKEQNRLQKLVRPVGHGFYEPSLNLSKELIENNDNESSALSLLLLSDGRPSDYFVLKKSKQDIQTVFKEVTNGMASRYGRRFTFSTIGMGSLEEFHTLEDLVDSARDYGGLGSFSVPSMSCAAIGRAISSVATSLTLNQTELMTGHAGAGRLQRRVRQCMRESRKMMPLLTEVISSDQFDVYMNDDVEHLVYKTLEDGSKQFTRAKLQHPDAAGVAMKRCAFGEGQERFAFQFFEVCNDGQTVVGPSLVAKEGRFLEDGMDKDGHNNWEARDKFAKRFCKVQKAARVAAQSFNKKLDDIFNLDPDTARVKFLDCSIYYLTHSQKGEFAVIVERKLEGSFQKWNNNNGWHRCRNETNSSNLNISTVTEEDDNIESGTENNPISLDSLFVTKEEVAQAFSHFSYIHSGKKMLICDLQGVYDRSKKTLTLTDPVIHYHDARKVKKHNRGVYGRTDMGQKGIQDFFKTHKCNCLCELVTKGFIEVS